MRVCINADDFGFRPEIDDAITSLADDGVVTSVSVLAAHATRRTYDLLGERPGMSAGLHFTLTTGRNAALPQYDGPGRLAASWLAGRVRASAVREELERQHAELVSGLGREPSHVDAHEHVHALPTIRRVLREFCKEHGVPHLRVPREPGVPRSVKAALLQAAFAGERSDVTFCGVSLMGGAFSRVNVRSLLARLERSRARRVVWMIHPGLGAGPPGDYAHREREYHVLRESVEDVRRLHLVDMPSLLA